MRCDIQKITVCLPKALLRDAQALTDLTTIRMIHYQKNHQPQSVVGFDRAPSPYQQCIHWCKLDMNYSQ